MRPHLEPSFSRRALFDPEERFADAAEPLCKELADLEFRGRHSADGVATDVGDVASHRIEEFADDRRRRGISAALALGPRISERSRRASFIKTAASRDAVDPGILALHVLHSAVARLCKKPCTNVCNQRTYDRHRYRDGGLRAAITVGDRARSRGVR